MYIVKSLLITIFIFISSNSFSQNHNKIETDLERVKKDIIDLQKFVYQNKSDTVSSSNNQDLSKINSQIELLLEKFISIEKQMIDMKDDITNLYQLYTSPQFDQNKKITSSNNLNIEESSSNLVVEKSNEEPSTQDLSITQSNVNKADEANSVEDLPKQTLGKLSISSLDDQKIINSEPSEEDLATLSELDSLIEEREINLSKPIIDLEEQLQLAKQSLASLDNQKAIENLMLIIESGSEDQDKLAEAYYLLGRTNYIENNIIESVKFFGIRHRDFENIERFKAENYFWLGKSLFGIGDQENGCLIMEDIIFSDDYLNNPNIIDDAKTLQDEEECGLIIN
ncbi:MAG: tetratricopeptide repeat protein [Alphaproteobacteria bacterium]|jgi:TolA-binding protein